MPITPVYAPPGGPHGSSTTPRIQLTRVLILLHDAANGIAEAAHLAGRAGHPERESSLNGISRSIISEMPGIESARDNAAG